MRCPPPAMRWSTAAAALGSLVSSTRGRWRVGWRPTSTHGCGPSKSDSTHPAPRATPESDNTVDQSDRVARRAVPVRVRSCPSTTVADGDVVDSDNWDRSAFALAFLGSWQQDLAVVDDLSIGDQRSEAGQPMVEQQQRQASVGPRLGSQLNNSTVGNVYGVSWVCSKPLISHGFSSPPVPSSIMTTRRLPERIISPSVGHGSPGTGSKTSGSSPAASTSAAIRAAST